MYPTPEVLQRQLTVEYATRRPIGLPKRRKRALSPPVVGNKRKRQRKRRANAARIQSPQGDCPLLRRLPPEIRLFIWELALGGDIVWIAAGRRGKLIHQIFPGNGTDVEKDRWRRHYYADPLTPTPATLTLHPPRKWSKLNLLLTCREIYSEAIDLLYTSNTFNFHRPWTLHFFRITILPKRFALVRNIVISYRILSTMYSEPEDSGFRDPLSEEEWECCCEAILAMTGLRKMEFFVLPLIPSSWNRIVPIMSRLKGLGLGEDGFQLYLPPQVRFHEFQSHVETRLDEVGLKCKVMDDVSQFPEWD